MYVLYFSEHGSSDWPKLYPDKQYTTFSEAKTEANAIMVNRTKELDEPLLCGYRVENVQTGQTVYSIHITGLTGKILEEKYSEGHHGCCHIM